MVAFRAKASKEVLSCELPFRRNSTRAPQSLLNFNITSLRSPESPLISRDRDVRNGILTQNKHDTLLNRRFASERIVSRLIRLQERDTISNLSGSPTLFRLNVSSNTLGPATLIFGDKPLNDPRELQRKFGQDASR